MHKFMMVSLTTIALATAALAQPLPAQAQQEGETRCGADGWVQRYSRITQSWAGTGQQCVQPQPQAAEPPDGEERCGPAGFVLRYSRLYHSWQSTTMRCQP